MGLEIKGKQKRKKLRVQTNINAKFAFLGRPEYGEHDCMIMNLSEGGLGLLSNTVVFPGDHLLVTFSLEDKNCTEEALVKHNLGKEMGIEFLNITPEYQQCIDDMMTYTARKRKT